MSAIDLLKQRMSSYDEDGKKNRVLELGKDEADGIEEGPAELVIGGNYSNHKMTIESVIPHDKYHENEKEKDVNASDEIVDKPQIVRTHIQLTG